MYGTGEPPSSSFRRRREVVGFVVGMAATGSKGDCKEARDDCAEGSKRESFFIFLRGLF
jgi:hypothetical protein